MDGSTKAILILFLLIGFGIAMWYFLWKTDKKPPKVVPGDVDTDKKPPKVVPGDVDTDLCDDGYTYMEERCCKSEDAFGSPIIDPKTGDCTRTPKPCNPKNPIKYGVYEYEPSGNCAFSRCISTYKYNSKTNACVPATTDPLYLDCMANTKGFVKVHGNSRPSDPNKASLWDADHDAYCSSVITGKSALDKITGKYYNGTCYISINQKCKKYPQMDNVGRFDDSTAGGPKDTSESLCKARVESWRKDCN